MPTPTPDDADPLEEDLDDEDVSTTDREEVLQWLEQLRNSDRSLYNMMALEVWSIAQTMDNLIPGFWNRFMENRQLALQEFLAQRQNLKGNKPPTASENSSPENNQGDMMEGDDDNQ